MPNHQMLNNVAHKSLTVETQMRPGLGDDVSYAHVFVAEFRQLQGYYPLFFHKNSETGQFEAIAMFGFAEQENLFLTDGGWQASYIPLSIQRRPFLIGFQNVQSDGVLNQEPVVFVDMDSPRVNDNGAGKKVFSEQGGQSEYLQHASSVLQAVHQGHEDTKHFIDALLEHDLIEPVSLKVTLKDGTNHELTSLYTIHEENVSALTGEALQSLHQQGYLRLIYMMDASMANLSELIEMKNATL